jgi:hypothetical protein
MQMSNTGNFNISTSTLSTSITTGALTIPTGGLAVGGNFNLGASITTSIGTNGNYFSMLPVTFTDSGTATSGTATKSYQAYFGQVTLNASNTGVTTTTASTVYIAGAPIAGTNETITNNYALLVGSGNNNLGTGTTIAGAISTKSNLLTGATSGTISLLPQAAAGTYNWNYPITAGAAGQVLTSQGGLTNAMTWTTSGTVTSVALSVPSFLAVTGSPITGAGTFNVTLSGSALPITSGGTGSTTATGSGSVVLQTNASLVTPVLGVASGTSLSLTSTTLSTSISTGSINTLGGLGVQGNMFIGSNITTAPNSVGSYITLNATTFTDNTTATSGTLATWNSVYYGQPTLTSTNTGVTTTNASTLYIAGAPIAGANETINNRYALRIGNNGNVDLGGGTTNVNTITLTTAVFLGTSTGNIFMQVQANAGSYNFNLPITAGTAGQVLTSQGGTTTAMTWTSPVTSVAMTVPSFLSVTGSPITSTGTFGVTLSGTALPITSGGTGSTTATGSGILVLQTSPALITPDIGVATGTNLVLTGNVTADTQTLTGATSGVVTVQPQAVAGTYNYNLPTTAGAAGQVLTSQGGGASAMTWTTLVANILPTYWTLTDNKVSGTNGGTFTAGAFQTRTLNTITSTQVNTAVTLNTTTSVITITPGTYYFEAHVPAYKVGVNLAQLFNTTNSTTALWGTSTNSGTADLTYSYSIIRGALIVATTTTYTVTHRCATTGTNTGFGIPTGFGNEIYTSINIRSVF